MRPAFSDGGDEPDEGRGQPIEKDELPPAKRAALFPEERQPPDDDDDIDVVALARASFNRAWQAEQAERRTQRSSTRKSSSTPPASPVETRRAPQIEGVPQQVVDLLMEQMRAAGVKPDVRRIRKAPGGVYEADLS